MNKTFLKSLIVAVAALFVVGISSCSKEDIEEVKDTLVGTMTATVDGAEWKATAPAAASRSPHTLIYGYSAAGADINIYVGGTAPGTYALKFIEGSADSYAVYADTQNAQESDKYYATTGTVVITSNTESRLSGTFTFTAARTVDGNVEQITITNGKFENILISQVK